MRLAPGPSSRRRRAQRRVLGLTALLLSVATAARAERLPLRTYDTADGLAHNSVNRIVKDSRGLLWFCTAEGLSRFDGYTFTTFGTEHGLPDANVNDLLETRSGDYWIATNGGLARFNPRGTPVRDVIKESDPTADAHMFAVVVPADGDRRGRAVTVLLEARDGTIWAGTQKGLARLTGAAGSRSLQRVEIGLPKEVAEYAFVADLLQDAGDSVWIAAPSGLYRRWPDGRTARYTKADGLPDDYIKDLLEDQERRLWAGTRLNGFFRFTPGGDGQGAPRVDLAFTYPADLPTSWVSQLFQSSDQRFWIATARGLIEFIPAGDDQGRHFRAYTAWHGLSDFDITAVNEDVAGNLWLGTSAAGAMKLARNGFTTYGERDGIVNVGAILEDRGGATCFRGLTLADARTSQNQAAVLDLFTSGLAYTMRFGCLAAGGFDQFTVGAVPRLGWGWVPEGVTLQARDGTWWIGTGAGLYRFPASEHLPMLRTARPLALYTARDGLAAPQVFRLFEDSRGNVWVSTIASHPNGLARWEPSRNGFRDLAGSPGLPSLEDDRPRSFGEDSGGRIWIGFNTALVRYADGRFTSFTTREGLPAGAVMDIHVDRLGRPWIASTRGGLARIENGGAKRPTFVTYTTAEGLSSNNSVVLTEDNAGFIYVGGGRGLDRLDPVTNSIKHFTSADGLPSGVFRDAFRDRAGVLWFGMTTGLARFAPAPEPIASAPSVWIRSLRINGQAQVISALGEQNVSLPQLQAAQNQVEIDFFSLRFGTGEVLRYQYRLEGTGGDWSAFGDRQTVTYAALAPGAYTFSARSVNSEGRVSPPATVTFTILRPVWQRWWFMALSAAALGLVIHSAYRYRLAHLVEVANMRTRIAADLHDDIGANLTRIALLSEVASREHAGVPGVMVTAAVEGGADDGPLPSIGRIARESVSSMGDLVWAISPARDTLLDLTRRMRRHADELFTARGIDMRFSTSGLNDRLKLGADIRRDLLLLFKEAVSNAARHSQCSRVEIDLRVHESELMLVVDDDGRGFDTCASREGHGIINMQRRAARLGGRFDVASRPGGGTRIALHLRL